jgi:NADPH:quinone reductase-like Zn-dependent oxidoreductase
VYGTAHGSFAEFAAADEHRLALKPREVSFEEAAVLPYPGAVSLQAIRDHARVRPGNTVLIVGASGAVGTIAVQIAKLFGAEVTGVCSAAAAEMVRGLGADDVIDYEQRDFTTIGRDFDVIIDTGGNTPLARLRRSLGRRGSLVIIGGEAGGRVLGGFHRQIGAQLLSPFVRQSLGTLIATENADILRSLNELLATGPVKPILGRTLALADAVEAIDDLDRRRTRGRLLLIP